MKHFSALAGSLAAALVLAGSAAAQDVTLRFHQFLPPQSYVPAEAITPWAAQIEAESDGRIKIERYDAMALGGSPAQLFDQAKDGVVDIVWTVLGYTPGRFPKSEAFELPFLISTDPVASSRAFQRYVEEYAADEFAGVKLITAHVHGPGLFHSKDPIEKLEDLQGMKIRGGSRIINEMLSALGAEPIGMPVPQVPEALSKGVIDGATIPWEVTTAIHTSELVHNHTGFSGDKALYTQTFAVVMNLDSYNALPDDLKAIIDAHSGVETAALFGKAMAAGDAAGIAIAEDLGNNIITLDPAETDRWKNAAWPTVENWIASTPNGQELYDAANALVAEESGM
ncbi:MAG: TRAP transporter substrate-binding protein [Hyphomicrobiaceae bacterium]|nr:TRAP transporter substrate-binding protein [Hyphomicrobiaceae bacterium]